MVWTDRTQRRPRAQGLPWCRVLARDRGDSLALTARRDNDMIRAMAGDFARTMAEGYSFDGPTLLLGAPLRDGAVAAPTAVRVPLAMMNRHGLIAGATGTGKTRTLQLLTDQLSAAGVPVFLADLKGDLSGLAAPGVADAKVLERAKSVGVEFVPAVSPVEFLSLTGSSGIPLRATVSSFGPLLLARALQLNETQKSVLSLVFKYCDDQGLLLLDLPDLKAVLQYLGGDGKEALREYGGISPATVGVLLRKMIELEQQGGDAFFGEPSFDVDDLLRTGPDGRGVVSALELSDIQDRPDLFSTFMMWLLASLYRELPEVGDLPKPKLVFFFDEAHLLFEGADKEFLSQVQQTVRLIRSKGVGVYFCSQFPDDVPGEVLGQLGNRVQHALRAFTPRDQKAVKTAAETFVANPKLDVAQVIGQLGVGEALASTLQEGGVPMPVERTIICPPRCRMGAATPEERAAVRARSPVGGKYDTPVNRESAYEILTQRAAQAAPAAEPAPRSSPFPAAPRQAPQPAQPPARPGRGPLGDLLWGTGRRQGMVESMAKQAARTVGSQLGRQILRGVLGGILGGTRR